MSAGTKSPAASSTTSPGTISADFTLRTAPPRITFAEGAESFLSASSAASARLSCTVPITTFSNITARMMIASVMPPSGSTAQLMIAAASSTRIIRFLNWLMIMESSVFFLPSLSAFAPCVSNRRAASCGERPSSFVSSASSSAFFPML